MRIKIRGIRIEAGASVDIPDLQKSEVAGLVRSRAIACDQLPKWYQTARRVASDVAVTSPPRTATPPAQTDDKSVKKDKVQPPRKGRVAGAQSDGRESS